MWRSASFRHGDPGPASPPIRSRSVSATFFALCERSMVFWDWAQGVVVGSGMFVLALGLMGLRDFIVVNEIPIADVRFDLRHLWFNKARH